MKQRMQIGIVGYGTAGQALALLLARDCHRVQVFECVPQPGPVGVCFLLQPTGLQVLLRIVLLPVGTRPGDPEPRVSFFWSLRTADFDAWQARGIDAWLDEVAQLWPQARERLAQVIAPAQLARASYRDAVQQRWYRGRLVLAGDAAHSMSPQWGRASTWR